jgi:hypothetical protein
MLREGIDFWNRLITSYKGAILQECYQVRGPCFEVADFTATCLDPGAYLGISEPFITRYSWWSSFFANTTDVAISLD